MPEYELRITLGGALQAGSRDACGEPKRREPMVPAAALKGALRSQLERLLRGLPPGEALAAGVCSRQDPCRRGPARCVVCRLFGGLEPGVLRFGAARIEDPAMREWLTAGGRTERVPVAAWARTTRTALPARGPALRLERIAGALMTARLEAVRALAPDELQALNGAVSALDYIGPGRARGSGACRGELVPVRAETPRPEEIPTGSLWLTLESSGEPLDCEPVGASWRPRCCVGGRTVRGALAAAWLERHGSRAAEDDPGFQRLFVDGELRVGWLWPGGRMPPPATLHRCSSQGDRHGLWDLLACTLAGARHGWPAAAMRPGCPECGAPLEAVEAWRQDSAHQRLVLRCHGTLDPALGQTRSVRTFAQWESCDERALPVLRGPARVPADLAGELAALGTVRVGSSRSRGAGACRVGLEADPGPSLASRVDALRRCFESEESAWAEWLGPARGASISDCVVVDLWSPLRLAPGRWPEQLLNAVGRFLPGTSLEAAFVRRERLGGYRGAAGLPAAQETVLAPGGVLVLRPVAGTRGVALLAALDRMEQEGLGTRRRDGLGMVRVADSVHARFARPLPQKKTKE
jgi:hypothetical protein